jgi:hypothetical protein
VRPTTREKRSLETSEEQMIKQAAKKKREKDKRMEKQMEEIRKLKRLEEEQEMMMRFEKVQERLGEDKHLAEAPQGECPKCACSCHLFAGRQHTQVWVQASAETGVNSYCGRIYVCVPAATRRLVFHSPEEGGPRRRPASNFCANNWLATQCTSVLIVLEMKRT